MLNLIVGKKFFIRTWKSFLLNQIQFSVETYRFFSLLREVSQWVEMKKYLKVYTLTNGEKVLH